MDVVRTVLFLRFPDPAAAISRRSSVRTRADTPDGRGQPGAIGHPGEACPMTHRHKWYLVEAERARVLQQEGEARVAYDKAIELAYQHAYLQDVALANELAARFYHALGEDHVAGLYFREAAASYRKWGALAKVRQLEAR